MYVFTCYWIYSHIFEEILTNLVHSIVDFFEQGFFPLNNWTLQAIVVGSFFVPRFLSILHFYVASSGASFFCSEASCVGEKLYIIHNNRNNNNRAQWALHAFSHVLTTLCVSSQNLFGFVVVVVTQTGNIHISTGPLECTEKNAFARKLRACRHTHAPSSYNME